MISKEEFLRNYSRELLEGHGAVFVGAGMSIPVGFVNWKDLLREIAVDLELDIDLEHDLIAVAQYEANRKRNRDSLDQAIIRQFCRHAEISENHRRLARLPIDTVWTTNYDKLLEKAFSEANRTVDPKHRVSQLRVRNPYADVTIFKMHGDVESPSEAVLTKDDYECYEVDREAFTVQLLSDLLSKRFLFLGFSFTDPNIEYTVNRLRRILNPRRTGVDQNRDHYCILKEPTIEDYSKFKGPDDERDRLLALDKKRFEYRVEDLKNYGIQTVAIQSYQEIEELLSTLNRRVRTRSVMISGAAETFDPLGDDRLNEFCRLLGRKLIEMDYDIISGFGKGISGSFMIGVHEALSRPGLGRIGQRMRLFPFPYWLEDGADKVACYEMNRKEMTSQGGVTIVISGNKSDPSSGNIIDSPGVATEVELARAAGQVIVPIGATGHTARKYWNAAMADVASWFPGVDASTELGILGDDGASPEELVKAALALLDKIKQ